MVLNPVAREVTSLVKLKLALPLVSLSGADLGEGSVAETGRGGCWQDHKACCFTRKQGFL